MTYPAPGPLSLYHKLEVELNPNNAGGRREFFGRAGLGGAGS